MVRYKAGPTGCGLQRLLSSLGIMGVGVALGLTPMGSGELAPVGVRGEEDEALRDRVRAREDAKQDLARARQRLSMFL